MHGVSPGEATVPVTSLGGLVTLAVPESLPEGASPRTYNTDYNVGQSKTRDGLTRVYNPSTGSAGPNNGAVATSSTWSNVNALLSSASGFASFAPVSSANSVDITEFSFALPTSDSIAGIQVQTEAYANTPATLQAQLISGGVVLATKTSPISLLDGLHDSLTITFGDLTDLWNVFLSVPAINAVTFGVRFTLLAREGYTGAAGFAKNVQVTIGVNTGLQTMQPLETFTNQDGLRYNRVMDQGGNLWVESLDTAPNAITLSRSGIAPGSMAVAIEGEGVEYMAFVNPLIPGGSDMPLQWTPTYADRITQVGPGAAPSFTPVQASSNTFAIATITQNPANSDITDPGHLSVLQQSSGPDSTAPGVVLTVFYSPSFYSGAPQPEAQDLVLVNAFNSGQAVYAYISGAPFGNGTFLVTGVGNILPPGVDHFRYYFTVNLPTSNYQQAIEAAGQYQLSVATMTMQVPVPGLAVGNQVTISGATPSAWDSTWTISQALNSGVLEITSASVTGGVATYSFTVVSGAPPVAGQRVTITNVINDNNLLNGTNLTIASSSAYGGTVSTSGTAVTWLSGNQFSTLVSGETIEIGGVDYVIFTVNSATSITLTTSAGTQTGVLYFSGTLLSGTFTIATSAPNTTGTPPPEEGTATTSGTIFAFDPGITTVGTLTSPIYGNTTVGGTLTYVAANSQLIGSGTKQGSVFFILRDGSYTAPAPPVTFAVPENTTGIAVTGLPIGPPNVRGRGIILTESGQDGVPGANFFTLPNPVEYFNENVSYTATAFFVNDNTSTSTTLSFPEDVLTAGLAVDVYGYNLFNLIEIGDPTYVSAYDSRNCYGQPLNKIQNLVNMSFDGGYLQATAPVPLGWSQPDIYGRLNVSPIFGNSYYISNTSGGPLAQAGLIQQTAYLDAYLEPIFEPNTGYSVRVTARCPSGITTEGGSLVYALMSGTKVLGSYSLPLSDLTTSFARFSGVLLPDPALTSIPSNAVIQIYAANLPNGADVEIDRGDPFDTDIPVLLTTEYWSYAGLPTMVDGVSGNVLYTSENQHPVQAATVLYDTHYVAKGWGGKSPGSSLYSLQASPSLEPADWDEPEVSQRSGGALGPFAWAGGEQWFVAASRAGLYLFTGGQPGKITQEVQQVWDAINWNAASSIWVDVNLKARRLMVGIPLPTPNFWLPNAPTNAAPTSPNVVLMLNFQGIDSGEELKAMPQMHTTMFGMLAAIDMRRKWSLWYGGVQSPYATTVQGVNGEQTRFGNGQGNSLVYFLDPTQNATDDGTPLDSLYTGSDLPNLAKRAEMPQLGQDRVCWSYISQGLTSGGSVNLRLLGEYLYFPEPAGYNTLSVPGGFAPGLQPLRNAYASLNFIATRTFFEWRQNDGNPGWTLSNIMLRARKAPWSAVLGIK
jgi:hypothetical protein